jgi:predicted GIY-YIG superfamily endonuclease
VKAVAIFQLSRRSCHPPLFTSTPFKPHTVNWGSVIAQHLGLLGYALLHPTYELHMTDLELEARSILDFLAQIPFADCIPISRTFLGLPTKPGIYSVRHRSQGILYIGKAQDLKERFRGGHKAITWSWLEDYNYRDVAIATYILDYPRWLALSSELEGIVLRWSKPPFNVRIPMRDEP